MPTDAATTKPDDDTIERIRQIIANHCFGPHDTKAHEERALDIASACTDDMVDEGLLAASHASPAAPADDEAAVERMRQAIHDELCACEGDVSPCPHSSVELNAAARAALAALREGTVRDERLRAELAALRASAVVLPEPVQRLVDWHLSVAGTNVARMPLQSEVREALESWRPAAVEAPLVSKFDLAAGICSCGNRFDGDNLCLPSACQMEDLTDAAGVSGTGTEAAVLADVPEAEWREFHADVTSARGPETQAGSPVVRARLKSRGIGDQS